MDPITKQFAQAFDYEFNGESHFETPKFIPPDDFAIGLIVGNSGSGKSLLLKEHFSEPVDPIWNPNMSVVAHFTSFEDASEKLFATGLSSVPSLCKPFHVLSNGEKYRATVARMIKDGMVCDEFTSVVDRSVAKSISVAISKYITKKNLKNIVFASCHMDIIEWLQPSWVFNTNYNDFSVNGLCLDKFPKLGSFEIT